MNNRLQKKVKKINKMGVKVDPSELRNKAALNANIISRKNKTYFTHEDWRDLAMYQNEAGCQCEDEQAYVLHQAAITSLTHIPKNKFTVEDWRQLAIYQDNAAYERKDEQAYVLHQAAITSLKRIPKNKFTVEDWRRLARYQNNAACEREGEQAYVLYQAAIASLKHISEDKFMDNDWRQLAIYQDNAAYERKGEEAYILHQAAIASLKHISEDKFMDNDWRQLAIYQDNAACEHKGEEAYILHQAAIASLKRIPENKFKENDWRSLASYQNHAACKCEDGQAYVLHQAAITSLTHIHEDEFTEADWRKLAIYQDNAACEREGEQAYVLDQAAITSLTHIQEVKFTGDDWRRLARYQYNAACERKDEQACALYQGAIASLKRIPENKFTENEWDTLTEYQIDLGDTYNNIYEFAKAQSCYYSVLNLYAKHHMLAQKNIQNIAKIYKSLTEHALIGVERQLNSYGNEIFSDENITTDPLIPQLSKLHLAVLQHSTAIASLPINLLLLMQLIINTYAALSFPNKTIKDWLSKPIEYNKFKNKMAELEKASKLKSLSDIVGYAPNLQVAVAERLRANTNEIGLLNKKIAALETQISTLQKSQRSIYARGLSTFKSSHPAPTISSTDANDKLLSMSTRRKRSATF